ncbi:1-deoxy-D-xylulose-5-phosphate reductoisomerase [Parabacteroides distasonis]|uniref:1-deoxy-D-xylulose-5-phosphate reductoisomerase n=1 Tax=Parabacteroides distasonis TaxID=823 RepID=UPI00189E0252|nr:1-deoxy-D-xylulose-5-phosphate reductoisomerase [Parabacteroides distasonis]MDB9154390.1 1-deoxy-D-xylulose-5-phosphate reductoisomerase [Parabacteroides distasonis]MDB9158932.1 1-deoxy-D-xylulose-5-phosphate reductoisomerase [Parabacteroides distasonis]MDB9167696.1 1-deoxy-D-xylulose-5-phosphate reductoisomerase [Parabacteroides distasonis]MDB9172237.1 1-deoxy-D-xylulose-5-phosphate reductoisomerase [Parabacteroides distasonis]MDB9195824.1 1-deoxy-D-xylulose-5-phosphate reductoisomerase [P
MKKRQLAILGSTGSIGTQALEVVSEHSDLFEVYALTANNQVDLLINQARKYMPEVVVIANERKYPELKEALEDLPIKVWAGADAIAQMVQSEPIDMVLTAMVGYSGLRPTISAIKAGKAIALANKETLVVAGELIMKLAAEHKVPILPVDSEHSAIFQCLTGAYDNPIEKILLTASGGPFRRKKLEELATVTKAQALKHPNWTMGAKITIDSASMMNKGFEMIEAKWLFDVTPDQVQVVVHPQSVIHSMVQFEDGAVIAQLGIPDMKLPIAYAFSFPTRMRSMAPRLDFNQYSTLTFEEPDMERFRNLAFAFEAARQGGNMPCILNAANEVVVAAFLQDRIGFLQMSDVIEQTMRKASFIVNPSYEDYVATDTEARRLAAELF